MIGLPPQVFGNWESDQNEQLNRRALVHQIGILGYHIKSYFGISIDQLDLKTLVTQKNSYCVTRGWIMVFQKRDIGISGLLYRGPNSKHLHCQLHGPICVNRNESTLIELNQSPWARYILHPQVALNNLILIRMTIERVCPMYLFLFSGCFD